MANRRANNKLCGATLVLLAVSAWAMGRRAAGADEKDYLFEAKIRPVLVEICVRCHSDKKASGGLRVDSREALLKGGDSGPAIIAGHSAESLLVRAILRHDDVSAMPPEAEQALRADQTADFVAWIDEGAPWPAQSVQMTAARHWAYEPIEPIAPPEVADSDGAQTVIDLFIRLKQDAVGIRPAPPADKRTLLRRATFDLTGLPPTSGEIEAFLRDESPHAFERVVERLLASPHYGERWGQHWLDVVRYADTAGETADYPAPLAWRYRNYVIDAFQSDKPYDEFVREQIAGDVLAAQGSRDRFAERVIATGFLAISRRFGFDSENYHHLTIQDTIDTLGQAVLGLSLGCARCHDHKFDDVTMEDYYALYGIFDSSRYAFPGSEQKQKTRSLAPLLPAAESEPRWQDYQRRVAAMAARLAAHSQPASSAELLSLNDIDGDFELQAPAAGGSNGVLVPPWLYDGAIAVTNAAQSPFKNLYALGNVGANVPAGRSAYRIWQSLHPRRTRENCRQLYVNLDFRVAASNAETKGAHRFSLGAIRSAPLLEVVFSPTTITLQTGDLITTLGPVTPNSWQNVQLALDLQQGTASGRVGAPGSVVEFADLVLSPGWAGAMETVEITSLCSSDDTYPSIEFDNLGVQETPISRVSNEPPAFADGESDRAPLAQLQQEHLTLLADGPFEMAYGMAEGTPHNACVQLRGEPAQRGEEVPRGFLRALGGGPLPAETTGSGRLELAEWLTRPENPLTARVLVNRIWKYHFGSGLVKTPNDFGVRGLPPTHPELLDYLAAKLMQSGWSVKSLHRLIMFSATYQQASTLLAAADPSTPDQSNEANDSWTHDLYTSFRRRRLSAEEIRDSILAVSGELDPTPGREHPFPSPTSWGYTQHAPFGAVYEHNKRSVYLMRQRIKRHPFLALFDGADPNATTADRLATTVPTQALYFLNDPFVHGSAARWAARLMAASSDQLERVELAYRDGLGRLPTSEELEESQHFLSIYAEELAATRIIDAEANSLAALLRAIIGSNEFLHVD